jgi:hypothetical protein
MAESNENTSTSFSMSQQQQYKSDDDDENNIVYGEHKSSIVIVIPSDKTDKSEVISISDQLGLTYDENGIIIDTTNRIK